MIRLRPSGADEVLIKRVRDWYEPGPGVFIEPQALFSPALLFTGSTNGAWYDPSDLTTLFRDAAGTLPVTAVEQPVGLMLDKSKGLVLGPELVTNGDGTSTTGWSTGTATVASTNGELVVTSTANTNPRIYQSLSVVAGRTYKISVTMRADALNVLANSARFRVGQFNTGGAIYSGPYQVDANGVSKTVTAIFTAGVSPVFVLLEVASTTAYSNAGDIAYFDNISVRELPGNHAFNASGNSANFPVLSARYNLLTKTEQFDNGVWTKTASGITPNTISAPDGTLTADTFTDTAVTSSHTVAIYPATLVNTSYTASVYVKGGTLRYVIVGLVGGTFGVHWAAATVDTQNGSITQTTNGVGVTSVSSSISAVGQGWYRVTVSARSAAETTFGLNVGLSDVSTPSLGNYAAYSYAGSGTGSIYIWGADLRVANDALNQPAYQRVNTSTDYDTVGFKPYLRFNGTNQWLQTNSIDFTYGDKVFVSAGVRKLSDAAQAIVVETSTSNGTFTVAAPRNAVPNYAWTSRGTLNVEATAPSSYSAPITNVVSGIGDISGSQSVIRVNSSQVANNSASQGTGNYSNLPLYIGARAGTSLWFNGRLYGMVVAGKQASASEIGSTETYINQKTGAY